jgi:histidinol-phosphate aminotransferase
MPELKEKTAAVSPLSAGAEPLVPANIEALSPYVPGKPVEELERELGISGAIKLASNENPLGPSPRGIAAAQAALASAHLYPDGSGHRLRQALAAHAGVAMDEIVLGAGSNEIIDLLVRTFCRPGVDEVLTHRYAFMMYRVSCGAHGVTMREAETTKALGCDVDALLAAVTPRTKLIFLPSPNNPTGSYVPRPAFERLLAALPARIILAVDEAYYEYASLIPDYPVAERYRSPSRPYLMTLRTFSKAYGLAALRVGWAIADRRIVDYLNRVRMPFNVSTPAQEAAIAALADVEHVERSRTSNRAGLAGLAAGFADLPVTAYPSAGNFVLVDVRRDANPVYQALLRRGVIVRPMAGVGLPTALRVSVGTAAENSRVLAAFAEVLAGG